MEILPFKCIQLGNCDMTELSGNDDRISIAVNLYFSSYSKLIYAAVSDNSGDHEQEDGFGASGTL